MKEVKFSNLASKMEKWAGFNLESQSESTLKISCSVLANSYQELGLLPQTSYLN